MFRLDVTPEQAQSLADELARAADAGLFHPSIVEPIAAGVEGTVAYRAEEYVAAESLDVAMRHYAPAAVDKALPFITQLAGAIDFARAAGVGHGALHPRDVFVTPDEARATGFGVVEALERVGLRAPVRRPYTAPERINGEPWGTAADVFSLAAITYELLTGRRPSGTGDQIGALAGDNVGDQAAAMHAVLARAMHDDPAERYPTALAFAGALEAAAGGSAVVESDADGAAAAAAPVAVPSAAVPPAAVAPAAAARNFSSAPDTPETPAPAVVEPESDDIAIERDEDEAHHDLVLGERPGDDASLFEGVEPTPHGVDYTTPSFAGLADEFREPEPAAARVETPDLIALDDEIRDAAPEMAAAARVDDPRALVPLDEEVQEVEEAAAAQPIEADVDLPSPIATYRSETPEPWETPVERPRSSVLPYAVGLLIGLLIGFGLGFVAGGRDVTAPAGTVASSGSSGTAATPEQKTPGKEWSEQSVSQPSAAQPGAAQAKPAEPPSVPPDAPGPAAPSAVAPPSGTTRPAATATRGRIVVQSTPSGASVTVNGQWRGRTPLKLENLRLGPYTIRIVQPGFAVVREEFQLSAAEPSRTMSVQLRKSAGAASTSTKPAPSAARPAPPATRGSAGATTGSLYVDSRPRGARVFVDGRAVGVTPVRLPDVQPGQHNVRLELADHRSVSARARVERGRDERVTVSLERIR